MDPTNSARTLELTVLFAEGLRVDRKPASVTKSNLFVTVRAESINSYTTCMAREGTENNHPTWNHKLLVDVPVHARSITFEVKSKGSSTKGAKDVGVARVAVSEFVGAAVPGHCLQFLSYRLRDWEGRCNGVLNFSVRVVNSPEYAPSPPAVKAVAATEKMVPCGIEMRGRTMGATSSSSSGVVTGVPVWWNNYGCSNV